MPAKPPARKQALGMPEKDRRLAPGAKGANAPLRKIKSVLARPLGIQRRGGQLHVVLVERRRARPADDKLSLLQLCEELRARLLAHGPDYAAKAMRHLVHVHDTLGRKGWPGVAALPGATLAEALAQAEMLASDDSSTALELIIEGLRPLQNAADLRDQSDDRRQDFRLGMTVEVSDSTHAEFDDLQRSWEGTTPSALMVIEREVAQDE